MVRRWLVSAVVVACSSTGISIAAAHADPRAVVELFTSQGCSSCPPADKLLGEFVHDPSLVPITLPIDYWDYLGWKDTLADPRNTARQKAYSQMRGDRDVYTPQAVVNGSVHVLGSDKAAIEQAIAQSRQSAATLSVPIKLSAADGHLTVSVSEGAAGGGAAEVWICGLVSAVTVAIGRGENRGKTITYHNVARQWLKLGPWRGPAQSWDVPIKDFEHDGIDEAAVLIQTGTLEKPSAMLGAAVATLH
jgi:hypothetical protein